MAHITQLNATGAALGAIAAINKGAAASTTQLAAAFSVLTPAQVANLAATQQLSAETFFLQMCASNMSDEAIVEAWTMYQAATAKTTDKAATDGLTLSVGNLTKALWANIKAIGTWLVTNPVGWLAIVAGVVVGATVLIDKFTYSIDDEIDKLHDLREEYDETESELQSLQDELETTQERMDELESYDALSFTEQGELEELKQTNKELERQIELLKLRNQEQANAVDEQAQNTWEDMNAAYGMNNKKSHTVSQVAYNRAYGNAEHAPIDDDLLKDQYNVYLSTVDYADWLITEIKRQRQLLSGAETALEADPNDKHTQNLIRGYTTAIEDFEAELLDMAEQATDLGLEGSDAFADKLYTALDPQYGWQQATDAITDGVSTAAQKLLDLKDQMAEFEQGNVDLTIRPEVEIDGGYETVLSELQQEFLGDGQEYAIHLTPILADGTKLSELDFDSYIDELLDGAVNANDILERDKIENGGLGLVLRVAVRPEGVSDEEWKAAENAWGQGLHELQGEYYDLIRLMRDDKEFLALIEILQNLGIISDTTAGTLLYMAESITAIHEASTEAAEAVNVFASLAEHLKQDTDLLYTAIENLKNGNIEAIFEAEALDDLLDAFPDLVDELEAYSKGLMTAEQLQDAFNAAVKDFKADEIYNGVNDVIDAVETYGVNSNKVKQAVQNLSKQIPRLTDALYDQETGQLKVSKSILESEEALYDYLAAENSQYQFALNEATSAAKQIIDNSALEAAGYDTATMAIYDQITAMKDLAAAKMIAVGNEFISKRVATGDTYSEANHMLPDNAEYNAAYEYWRQISKLVDDLETAQNDYDDIWDAIGAARDRYTLTSSSSSSDDPWKDAFEAEYAYHEHLVHMEQETLSDFYAWLDSANQKYFANREKYIDEYRKYTEEVFDGLRDLAEDAVDDAQHQIDLLLHQRDAITGIGFDEHQTKSVKNTQMIQMYQELQDTVHQTAESIRKSMRAAGWSEIEIENSSVLQSLSDDWWEFSDAISDIKQQMVDDLLEIVEATSDAVDSIQDVYDALHDAADEYAENEGFISVDTFQALVELGPQYMQYLRDENGLLIINEENIQKVIAAKTQQLALDNAMAYVERLRLALQKDSVEDLNELLYATTATTDATWGLVYANLALLDLSDDQYQAALHNINALRSLADNAVLSIGKVGNSLSDTLQEMKDGLDDILDYVMDMIKWEIEQQIEALEDAKDAYAELIELKKESMDTTEKETEYQEEVADKVKEIAKLQERINALSLDDSREAQAEKISLEEELRDLQKDLADYQAEYSKDKQEESLDDMLEAYEKEKDEEIEALEDSISSTQKLYELAIERINTRFDTLYDDLISWNTSYGRVLNDEITSAWANCLAAAQRYGSFVEALGQIDADIEAAGSSGVNTIVGSTSDYSAEISAAEKTRAVKSKIAEMQANSAAWYAGNPNNAALEARNQQLASEISDIIGEKIQIGKDGVWYIGSVGGAKLYDNWQKYIYHSGGIAGNDGSLKENELLAKLEKGEAVVSNQGKAKLFSLIDFADKLVQKLNLADTGNISRRVGDASMRLTPAMAGNAPSIQFGDVYISGADKSTVEEHRKINREFTNEIIKYFGIKK